METSTGSLKTISAATANADDKTWIFNNSVATATFVAFFDMFIKNYDFFWLLNIIAIKSLLYLC